MTKRQCALRLVEIADLVSTYQAARRPIPVVVGRAHEELTWMWDHLWSHRISTPKASDDE